MNGLATWSAERRVLALSAVLVATLTGALFTSVNGPGAIVGMGAYLVLVVVAVFLPAGIAVQVVFGQLLVAVSLLGSGVSPWTLLPMVAGVVATAELLAVVARLDSPLRMQPEDVPQSTATAAVIGAGVFGVVLALGSVPGPTGLLAVVLASVACAALAVRLAA